MLICPKNKFIFFKPMKMAGSSIELGLLKYCDDTALCTGSRVKELGKYEYTSKNNHDELGRTKFHKHTWPKLFFDKIKNKNIFQDYHIITAIRNPWDQIVSYYWYGNKQPNMIIKRKTKQSKAQKNFENFVNTKFTYRSYEEADDTLNKDPIQYISYINEKFIDDKITDYIYFENINNSFYEIGAKIIVDFIDNPLPRLKADRRKIKKHYSWYYNDRTRKKVKKYFEKTINRFNYKFEIK